MFFVFFFFKQKTAYEMRISDWSSDVCSSDLAMLAEVLAGRAVLLDRAGGRDVVGGDLVAEQRQQAGALDVGDRRRRGAHALEIGRMLHVGRIPVPAVGLDRKSTRLNSSH